VPAERGEGDRPLARPCSHEGANPGDGVADYQILHLMRRCTRRQCSHRFHSYCSSFKIQEVPGERIVRHATTCCRTQGTIEIRRGAVIACAAEKQFADLERRRLLHASRAGRRYGLTALHVRLRAVAGNPLAQISDASSLLGR
jgi:hypothetical protein